MDENGVDSLQSSLDELTQACDAIIDGWVGSLELRDSEPKGHTECLAQITLRIARMMGLGETDLRHVRRGAKLHDIGKMGIPAGVLMEPDNYPRRNGASCASTRSSRLSFCRPSNSFSRRWTFHTACADRKPHPVAPLR